MGENEYMNTQISSITISKLNRISGKKKLHVLDVVNVYMSFWNFIKKKDL